MLPPEVLLLHLKYVAVILSRLMREIWSPCKPSMFANHLDPCLGNLLHSILYVEETHTYTSGGYLLFRAELNFIYNAKLSTGKCSLTQYGFWIITQRAERAQSYPGSLIRVWLSGLGKNCLVLLRGLPRWSFGRSWKLDRGAGLQK